MQSDLDSRLMGLFTARPLKYFTVAFAASLVVLAVVLQLISMANAGDPGLLRSILGAMTPSLQSIDASSAALEAVIGTSVVGASALVALLVAVAALRASEANNVLAAQQNALASHANELSDPDYVLSHQAYSAYRKYGFLFGSLIASFRTYRHEKDLASYAGADDDEEPAAPAPRWDSILAELKTLLLDTPFQVAALEAAKVLDRADGGTGDANQHHLRKAFANALSALEQQTKSAGGEMSPERALAVLLAQASLLDRQLRRGLEAVTHSNLPDEPGSEGRLVHYLKRWMGEIQPIQVGEDFAYAVRASAFAGEEFASALGGGLTTWQKMVEELLEDVFVAQADWRSGQCEDPFGNGLHRAMSIGALCGDHATAMQLREEASEFAEKNGWTPWVVPVRNKASLPVPPRPGNDLFYIFHVTRKTLPLLFDGHLLGPYTRGCVIVDGLRSVDMTDLEDKAARVLELHGKVPDREPGPPCSDCKECPVCGGCPQCGTCAAARPGLMDAFIDSLTKAAFYHGYPVTLGEGQVVTAKRSTKRLTTTSKPGVIREDEDEAAVAEGPKLAWIGIDYRQIGVDPPTRDEGSELWTVFTDFGMAVSDEVRELTKM